MTREKLLPAILILIAVVIAGVFGYIYLFKGENPISFISPKTNSSNTSGAGATRTKSQLPAFPSGWDKIKPGPNVNQEMPADKQQEQMKIFKMLVERINKTPDSPSDWIDIGLTKKIFDDYAGARDAWEYAGLLNPKLTTPFENLGDLYWHFLQDYPKAELNYKKALANSPDEFSIYKDLSDMYRFSYKEKSGLAVNVLLEAHKKYPSVGDIAMWLGDYYRNVKDYASAKTYYAQALKLDPSNEYVKGELSRLK